MEEFKCSMSHCDIDDEEEDGSEWLRPVEDPDVVIHQSPKGPSCSDRSLLHTKSVPDSKHDHLRTIVHIDIDCFYAQVEMVFNPALRDVPLGIQQKYLVVTCNYPARARGVTKLMGIAEAKKICPELVLVSGENLTRYREMSYKISEFLMKYTPYVERLGFDENFLDVTEMVEQRIQGGTARPDIVGHIYAAQDLTAQPEYNTPCPCGCHYRLAIGSQIAADIRSAMNIELGITCCAGIAHNKLLAKVVGSMHKPNQQTMIHPCHAVSLITGLDSVRHIPGIGSATSKRLRAIGVVSVADLQQFPHSKLEEEFGVAVATTISQLSFAVDDTPVVTYSRPQMLSIEDSFRQCKSEQDARMRITQLISNLLPRAQEDGRTPHTLRLTVRKANKENRYAHRESRQCNLPNSIVSKISTGQLEQARDQLVSMVMALFYKLVNTKQPFHLTLINIAFAKLEETAINNISTFFTSRTKPDPASSSVHLQPEDPDNHSFSNPDHCSLSSFRSSSTNQDSNRSSDILSQKIVKRGPPNDITCTFSKKQKIAETSVDCSESTAHGSRQYQNHWSQFKTEEKSITLPPEVDPEVFKQLPLQIQQEILQTFSQERLPNNNPVSVQSIPDSMCSDRDQSDSEEKVCVSKMKPIFSPTKSKKEKLEIIQDGAKTDRQDSKEKLYDDIPEKRCIDTKMGSIKIARQDEQGNSNQEEEKVEREMLPASMRTFKERPLRESTTNCFSLTCTTDSSTESSDGMPHSSILDSPKTKPALKSNTENDQLRNSSLVQCINKPKMSVPKGVAPDVFSALPPDIQREVAAEMAMVRHNVIFSAGSCCDSQSRSQAKSPVKKVNSMWNYLKKQ